MEASCLNIINIIIIIIIIIIIKTAAKFVVHLIFVFSGFDSDTLCSAEIFFENLVSFPFEKRVGVCQSLIYLLSYRSFTTFHNVYSN